MVGVEDEVGEAGVGELADPLGDLLRRTGRGPHDVLGRVASQP